LTHPLIHDFQDPPLLFQLLFFCIAVFPTHPVVNPTRRLSLLFFFF
jgi:hypothetical protein